MRFWVNLVAIGLLCVCVLCCVHGAYAVTAQEAADQVAAADAALRDAFRNVLDAEQNGVNVSAMLPRLNQAGDALTVAEDALKVGNYSDAVSGALTSKSLAIDAGEDALVLKNDAVAGSGNWWITVLLSVVASLVFVGGLFVLWRRFKGGYLKKMLKSRPEVTD